MNILHYTIGLPPVRRGGSVQYANDLIHEQAKKHNVFVLICGDTLFKSNKCSIKLKHQFDGFKVYFLTNPLTPTLIYGTSDPEAQYKPIKINYENIKNFIIENKIEVLHMHTLMGMHCSIVRFIKELGIRIYYTTHDFHGVCPRYNLLDYKGNLCNIQGGEKCATCNLHEPSEIFLRIANSTLYHFFKSKKIISGLRKLRIFTPKKYNDSILSKNHEKVTYLGPHYEALITYYREYFRLFDKIHFNSNQTKEIFRSFVPDVNGEVINVVTSGITDKRKLVTIDSIITFGFIGSLNDYKGFPMLKRVLMKLMSEGYTNFQLNVYGGGKIGIDEDCQNIKYMPSYSYSELSDILYHLDGVIVPSKCYETFSLVTLESLAHGRPVFVSDHVGARDVVAQYNSGCIFSSAEQLKTILKMVFDNPEFLNNYSQLIMERPWPFSIHNHAEEIIKFYQS